MKFYLENRQEFITEVILMFMYYITQRMRCSIAITSLFFKYYNALIYEVQQIIFTLVKIHFKNIYLT